MLGHLTLRAPTGPVSEPGAGAASSESVGILVRQEHTETIPAVLSVAAIVW
jgi:hypothetical protein